MHALLITTAILEAGTGVLLLVSPAVPVSLLLGTELDTPSAVAIARIAGAALLSLGTACWLARKGEQQHAAKSVIAAMLLYNIAAVVILGLTGLSSAQVGLALWPVVVLHGAMALWCGTCLRKKPG